LISWPDQAFRSKHVITVDESSGIPPANCNGKMRWTLSLSRWINLFQ